MLLQSLLQCVNTSIVYRSPTALRPFSNGILVNYPVSVSSLAVMDSPFALIMPPVFIPLRRLSSESWHCCMFQRT